VAASPRDLFLRKYKVCIVNALRGSEIAYSDVLQGSSASQANLDLQQMKSKPTKPVYLLRLLIILLDALFEGSRHYKMEYGKVETVSQYFFCCFKLKGLFCSYCLAGPRHSGRLQAQQHSHSPSGWKRKRLRGWHHALHDYPSQNINWPTRSRRAQ
jgi:hypothetical protein